MTEDSGMVPAAHQVRQGQDCFQQRLVVLERLWQLDERTICKGGTDDLSLPAVAVIAAPEAGGSRFSSSGSLILTAETHERTRGPSRRCRRG